LHNSTLNFYSIYIIINYSELLMSIKKMMSLKLILKISNSSRILFKCHFESFKLIVSSVSTTFFFKIKRNALKSCNWFQIFCIRKVYIFLCKYMFIWWSWWKTKSYENFKVLKFWRKGYKGKDFFLKPFS
jgi:hypothetical protein